MGKERIFICLFVCFYSAQPMSGIITETGKNQACQAQKKKTDREREI